MRRLALALFALPSLLSAAPAEAGPDQDLIEAVLNDDLAGTRAALDAGANPKVVSRADIPLIYDAVREADYEIVALLLERGADPDPKLDRPEPHVVSPLHEAILRRRYDVMRLLLDLGADPNAVVGARTHLTSAVLYSDAEAARMLLEAGAEVDRPNSSGLTPLHEWARSFEAKSSVLTVLLEYGVDLESRLDDGATPLMEAAFFNNLRNTLALLSAGADVFAKKRLGQTALHYAALALINPFGASLGDRAVPDQISIVNALISAGAAVDARDNEGITPLMVASAAGGPDLVQWLIAAGADPNADDDVGQTPLVYAVMGTNPEALKTLMRNGADPNRADRDGHTALSLAREQKFGDAIPILERRPGALD